MENNTLDLVAKLLANENINVVREDINTAAFDTKSRTLFLPNWKDVTKEVDEMLVAHEVAHALFTLEDYVAAFNTELQDIPNARMYANIFEDVRVEKLIKRRYLGLRKTFNAGYRELNERDFFSVKSRDLSDLHLMDRINLYFKVGYNCGVEFTPAEKKFVVRAEQTETIADVVQLVLDVHEFIQQNRAAKQASQSPEDSEESEDFENSEDGSSSFDLDEDYDYSDDSSEEMKESDKPGRSNDELEGQTEESGRKAASDISPEIDPDQPLVTAEAFNSRVAELANTDVIYKYYNILPPLYNPILSYKETANVIATRCPTTNNDFSHIRKFKEDTKNNVDYLVKEFEMKKAAAQYKRQQRAKSGSLDMNKVWSYKLNNNDMFKRVTKVVGGKNHGMIFLLDWSGSMRSVINDTIKQVINLALFCQRAQIAFQVFAFVDSYGTDEAKAKLAEYSASTKIEGPGDVRWGTKFYSLIELFSSKMSMSEFNQSVNNLMTNKTANSFSMNGTPLNEALLYMYNYIETFQKSNNVEKVALITLTDGEGGNILNYVPEYTYIGTQRKTMRHFFKDTLSKKNIEFNNDPATQTRAILEMIKNRYNISILGFYLISNSKYDLKGVIQAHYDQVDRHTLDNMVDRMRSEFRTNGYASLKGTGRDDLFIIPTSLNKIAEGNLTVDNTLTPRAIAKLLGKYMTVKKTSRYLLNKFIGYVA